MHVFHISSIDQCGIIYPTAYITEYQPISETKGPKLEKCRSYPTKRSINYNDALQFYIVWENCAANNLDVLKNILDNI